MSALARASAMALAALAALAAPPAPPVGPAPEVLDFLFFGAMAVYVRWLCDVYIFCVLQKV
ncbi:MAG: hypothetical protein J3R72DRAFT_442217 [Linnemannia gamsii]|nr:MAG: hypothetical protein J3R72DRAFT_442217 [Linnemannia gamsii]